MRFAVVADSHIRLPNDDVATYPSNALMADRSRWVVQACNRLGVEFVVHLGDVVHPLPAEPEHEAALQLAAEIYADLEAPIFFVPGNHDVGDKPDALVAVPAVSEEYYEPFGRYWGPAFQSFDRGDRHFVILDTPVLNSGLSGEAQQRSWLEQDLAKAAAAGRRTLLFTHYPPFVRDPAEAEHYDNIGEPARSWLLGLLDQYQVEAVFSGHVHNFVFNHRLGTDLYVMPATGFVRPDYSELAAIEPVADGGRDDVPKLGFFIVDVCGAGHAVRPVRSFGAHGRDDRLPAAVAAAADSEWRSPIGVSLRHGWMTTVDFPTAGLDEFRRKRIRNDYPLLALWETRIDEVRIPLEDVASVEGAERVAVLSRRGFRFTVRSAGVPTAATNELVSTMADRLHRWEIVVWPHQYPELLSALDPDLDCLVAVSPIVSIGPPGRLHHFVTAGLACDDQSGATELAASDPDGLIAEIGFRVRAGVDVGEALDFSVACAERLGRKPVVDVALPRTGENERFDDEAALARLVTDCVAAAGAFPDVAIFLDGFMDHDRSYYRHIGLIDRRFNPRPGYYELIAAARSV